MRTHMLRVYTTTRGKRVGSFASFCAPVRFAEASKHATTLIM